MSGNAEEVLLEMVMGRQRERELFEWICQWWRSVEWSTELHIR
jgi:hypothetical protein